VALFNGMTFTLQASKTHSFNNAGVFTPMDPKKSYRLISNFFAFSS
jgi:hypothetical protein